MATRRRIALRAALLALIGGGAIAFYFSPLSGWLTLANLHELTLETGSHWYTPILFIFAYAIGCTVLIPASLFVILAGLIWGWKLGGAYALTGGVAGATLSFALARYLGGGLLEKLGTRGKDVSSKLQGAGFKTMLIVRLIPVFPFAVLNYGAGLTTIRLRDYFWGTLIGTAPSHFVVAYSAHALLSGTLSKGDAMERLLIAGALVAIVVLVPALLKRRLEKAVGASGPE